MEGNIKWKIVSRDEFNEGRNCSRRRGTIVRLSFIFLSSLPSIKPVHKMF